MRGIVAATVLALVASLQTSIDNQVRLASDPLAQYGEARSVIDGGPFGIAMAGPPVRAVVLCRREAMDRVRTLVREAGGVIEVEEERIGYLRIAVEWRLYRTLASFEGVEALAPDTYRGYKRLAIERSGETPWPRLVGTVLGLQHAPRAGEDWTPRQIAPAGRELTATDVRDALAHTFETTGVRGLRRLNDRFDGRGATIAVLETSAGFLNPSSSLMGPALTLDGIPTPKLADLMSVPSSDAFFDDRLRPVTEIGRIRSPASVNASGLVIVGRRRLRLPGQGEFHFGAFTHAQRAYEVVWSAKDRRLWLDTDGDSDFAREEPVRALGGHIMTDRVVGQLARDGRERFAVSLDEPGTTAAIRILASAGNHAERVAVAAAGADRPSATARQAGTDYWMPGVAPAAQIIGVGTGATLSGFVESLLLAARRPDVDVITMSEQTREGTDFQTTVTALATARIAEAFDKVVVFASGNGMKLHFMEAPADKHTLIVGASDDAKAQAFAIGVKGVHELTPWHFSPRGPSLSGLIKPDVLAPGWAVYNSPESRSIENMGAGHLPKGYVYGIGTSISAPRAAAMAALLISAVRQTRVNVSAAEVVWAIRHSARHLDQARADEQGHGVIDVERAWQLLRTRAGSERPRIQVQGSLVNVLAAYAPPGSVAGIYEMDGFELNRRAARSLRLTRTSGAADRDRYTLRWLGNDGTFAAQEVATLPLHTAVTIPIGITPRTTGLHAAILQVVDAQNGDVVDDIGVTIGVPEALSTTGRSSRSGSVPFFGRDDVLFRVPPEATVLDFELTVHHGSLRTMFSDPAGVSYAWPVDTHGHVGLTKIAKGTFRTSVPVSERGTIGVTLPNDDWFRPYIDHPLGLEARYTLTMEAQGATGTLRAQADGISANWRTSWSPLHEPQTVFHPGSMAEHRAAYWGADGAPTVTTLTIDKSNAGLYLEAEADEGDSLTMSVFDCSSGYCFHHQHLMQPAAKHTLHVAQPAPGRWQVVVYPGPRTPGGKYFRLRDITMTAGTAVAARALDRTTWTSKLALGSTSPPSGRRPVTVARLIDLRRWREEKAAPFGEVSKLRDAPRTIALQFIERRE